MANEAEKFMQTGLTHYPAALLAVRRFEATVRAQLSEVLGRRAAANSQVSYATGKGDKLYLEATRRIRTGPRVEATVAIGLAWDEDPCYLYLYCVDGPSWALHPVGDRFGRFGGTTYFFEDGGPAQGSIPKRLERLMKDWLTAVAKAARGRKT